MKWTKDVEEKIRKQAKWLKMEKLADRIIASGRRAAKCYTEDELKAEFLLLAKKFEAEGRMKNCCYWDAFYYWCEENGYKWDVYTSCCLGTFYFAVPPENQQEELF